MEVIAKFFYVYLFLLATAAFIYSLRIGKKVDTLCFTGNHVYYAYISVIVLSCAQMYQSLQLIKFTTYFTDGWWVPFFCKQLSIFVYLAVLSCINSCRQCKDD